VFEWMDCEHLRPDVLLYFTDAMGEFPEDPPPFRCSGWSRARRRCPGADASS